MREIKFRAWDLKTKTMHTVENINFCGRETVTVQYNPIKKISLDSVYLMQYIGVQDKSGVEIYEGDVIHWDPVRPVESYTPTYAKTKRLDDYIIQLGGAGRAWARLHEHKSIGFVDELESHRKYL